jgi:hypothetical protein
MARYMAWWAFPREWLAALRGLFDYQEVRFTGEVLEIKRQLGDEHPDGVRGRLGAPRSLLSARPRGFAGTFIWAPGFEPGTSWRSERWRPM